MDFGTKVLGGRPNFIQKVCGRHLPPITPLHIRANNYLIHRFIFLLKV